MGSIITPTVTFGNPQPGGNICVGKGVCKVSQQQPGTSNSAGNQVIPTSATAREASHPQGIQVLFQVSPLDRSVLVMSFRLSDLEKNQPEQVKYFASGEYIFDDHYSFHHPAFDELKLHHNPKIEKGKKNQVHIVGDLVTTFFHYSHGN